MTLSTEKGGLWDAEDGSYNLDLLTFTRPLVSICMEMPCEQLLKHYGNVGERSAFRTEI